MELDGSLSFLQYDWPVLKASYITQREWDKETGPLGQASVLARFGFSSFEWKRSRIFALQHQLQGSEAQGLKLKHVRNSLEYLSSAFSPWRNPSDTFQFSKYSYFQSQNVIVISKS